MRIALQVRIGSLAIILALLAPSTLALAETNPKFDSLRLENEHTLDVPLENAESLWAALQARFKDGWHSKNGEFVTLSDVENFVDTYFDTPERTLLRQAAGLRHRRRFFPDGTTKELIQLKQPSSFEVKTADTGGGTRGELKFELANPTVMWSGQGGFDDEELLTLVKPPQRSLLVSRVAALGANADRLAPLITIRQERRRVYFRENGIQHFTITLDIASSKKYWLKGKFAQLDIEIGEIAFTSASPAERERLIRVQRELFDILQGDFPYLRKNQTPKVVMMINNIEGQGIVAKLVLRFGETLLLTLGMIALCFGLLAFSTRKRLNKPYINERKAA